MKVALPPPAYAAAALLLAAASASAQDKDASAPADADKAGGAKDYAKAAARIFAVEYLPIGHLRTDPIISRDCLSDHVHTFYGPPKIHPAVTFDELRDVGGDGSVPHEATSGNVLENQSLYW